MMKSKFSELQIISILKQTENGRFNNHLETYQLSRRIRFLQRKNAGFGRFELTQNSSLESRINWEAPNYVKLNEHNILAKILWNIFLVRGFLTLCN